MISPAANSPTIVTIIPSMKLRMFPPQPARILSRSSICLQPARFFHDIAQLREEMFLLRRRKRHRRVQGSDTKNRSVQVVECLFVDDRSDFAANAAGPRVLVQDDDL